jgi:hypothetical protein
MEDKIKCSFRGNVYSLTYYLNKNWDWDYSNDTRIYFYRDIPQIQKGSSWKSHETFYTCESEKPPFEVNEKVFIPDLDLEIKIIEKIRSIDGSYVYKTDHNIRIEEDEETNKSLEIAKDELKNEMIKYNEWSLNRNKTSKKWYQFWKS